MGIAEGWIKLEEAKGLALDRTKLESFMRVV
jgi:hypothetical protein